MSRKGLQFWGNLTNFVLKAEAQEKLDQNISYHKNDEKQDKN